MKIYTGFLFLILTITSCNSALSDQNSSILNEGGVIRQIPRDKRTESYRSLKSDVENKLGLYALENGFDSLEIRIWLGYAGTDKEQLIIIKNDSKQWLSSIHLLTYVYIINRDSLTARSDSINNKVPKIGFARLIDSLNYWKVSSLPDMSDVPNYQTSIDGSAITVEIATKKSYRIYTYQNPYFQQDKFEEARNIERIIEILEREFDFKRLMPL
jgi:hypothetical protein